MWMVILIGLVTILLVIVVISITWTALQGGPWVPTPMRTVRKMLELADVGPQDLVYDLGCGDGRTVIIAARRCGARAVGIEIDPLRFVWCQALVTILGLRERVTIIYGDFFKQNISEATVVVCYLLQDTNYKLEGKFVNELRPGARVVSNTFTFPGMKLIRQDGKARLYELGE